MTVERGLMFSEALLLDRNVEDLFNNGGDIDVLRPQIEMADQFIQKLNSVLTVVSAERKGKDIVLTLVGDRDIMNAVDCHMLNHQLYNTYPINVLFCYGGRDE